MRLSSRRPGQGLVATAELTAAGKRVLLLDQEGPNNLGGQAFWSLSRLMLIDGPSSAVCACTTRSSLREDWTNSAGFDRLADGRTAGPRAGHAPTSWAAGGKGRGSRNRGITFVATVGWPHEDFRADGTGNSVRAST